MGYKNLDNVKWMLQNEKKKMRKMLRFLDRLQVLQHATPPHWKVQENLKVGFGITLIFQFVNSYSEFRDDKIRWQESKFFTFR